MATVFIVDDDPSALRALGRLIRSADLQVALFASATDFLAQQDPQIPGCLVLDVAMSGLNGPDLQRQLVQAGNSLPVVFLTGNGDIPMSVAAMKSGAVDFLSKPCPDDELLEAVNRAIALDESRRRQRNATKALTDLVGTLTPREHQVMLGVVAGRSNKEISADIGAAEKTIKIHRARVMAKLRVDSIADLVRFSERLAT